MKNALLEKHDHPNDYKNWQIENLQHNNNHNNLFNHMSFIKVISLFLLLSEKQYLFRYVLCLVQPLQHARDLTCPFCVQRQKESCCY